MSDGCVSKVFQNYPSWAIFHVSLLKSLQSVSKNDNLFPARLLKLISWDIGIYLEVFE